MLPSMPAADGLGREGSESISLSLCWADPPQGKAMPNELLQDLPLFLTEHLSYRFYGLKHPGLLCAHLSTRPDPSILTHRLGQLPLHNPEVFSIRSKQLRAF